MRVLAEVLLMIPIGCATEAPQDQVMARIVPWVPSISILEHTEVRSKDAVRLGPHLLVMTDKSTCAAVICPG